MACLRRQPYLLSWDDENCYLIVWYDRYNGLAHFHVDKTTDVKLTAGRVSPLKHPLDAAEYARRTFHMFAGKTRYGLTLSLHFDY